MDRRFVVITISRDGMNPEYCTECGAIIAVADDEELKGAITGELDASELPYLHVDTARKRDLRHFPTCRLAGKKP